MVRKSKYYIRVASRVMLDEWIAVFNRVLDVPLAQQSNSELRTPHEHETDTEIGRVAFSLV